MLGLIRVVAAAVAAVLPPPRQAGGAPALAWSLSPGGNPINEYDYGTVNVGQGESQMFALTNADGSATGMLTVTFSGSAAFGTTVDTCTATSLGPRKSCRVTVEYSPSGQGASDGGTLTARGKKPAASASLTLKGAGAVSRHLYWANAGGSRTIGRANVDGSNPNQTFISGIDPVGVAVDANSVYWGDAGTGTIGRADLDGSNPNQSFISGVSAVGVAVDANYVYWANEHTATIGRATLDGSNPNPSFIGGASRPVGVAVDANSVYWADAGTGTIGRADLDGSNPNQSFISGVSAVGVAVDANYVYWANEHTGTIGRATLDGSNPNPNFIFADFDPAGVAVDSSYVYWTVDDGRIGRASLDGSNPNLSFVIGLDVAAPIGVAVDRGS